MKLELNNIDYYADPRNGKEILPVLVEALEASDINGILILVFNDEQYGVIGTGKEADIKATEAVNEALEAAKNELKKFYAPSSEDNATD